jgi:RNA polymerase sigma-70 factor (ECF subfamily)
MSNARKLFEVLVREHADMLTAFLTSVVNNPSDVDDLFQETMVVAWRRLGDFDQTRAFGPWLRGIAKNLVLAHHRRRVGWTLDPAVLEGVDSRLEQLSAQPGDTWDEKLQVLRACVESLPEPYRKVVELRYFHQRAVRQVSEVLQLSNAAVKKRLQRARSRVLDCVQRKLAPAEVPL